jgi:hypothetical protein
MTAGNLRWLAVPGYRRKRLRPEIVNVIADIAVRLGRVRLIFTLQALGELFLLSFSSLLLFLAFLESLWSTTRHLAPSCFDIFSHQKKPSRSPVLQINQSDGSYYHVTD